MADYRCRGCIKQQKGGQVLMKWMDAVLYKFTDGEKDELGNAKKNKVQLWSGQVRFTPWTVDPVVWGGTELTKQDREVMKTEQRYAVPVDYDTVKDTAVITIDGKDLKVTEVMCLAPRWTVIQAKVYKP